jgi:hypothetical protein
MSDHEILVKSIKRVRSRGWRAPTIYPPRMTAEGLASTLQVIGLRDIIFSHDFAKALWGEEQFGYPECTQIPFETVGASGYDVEYLGKKWQYHLQQMVIADDPIKYLEKNL